ncbi:MAG: hypothetical protein J6C32_01630 [Eubacterium sp.]|nr:hypothetical protein [Eubacterium sp.]
MGIMGYSRVSPFRAGTTIARTGVSRSVSGRFSKKNNKKKTKKVQYSFKQLSTQIMRTKKSINAGQAVSSARQKVAGLQRKLYTGEYDDNELKIAIKHAEAMVRIAKKRKKHLQEEEQAGRHGGLCQAEFEEEQEEKQEEVAYAAQDAVEISEEEMRQLMRELQQEMQDLMEDSMQDLEQEMLSAEEMTATRVNMDPEDLEALKKKHRAEELREILEADMKYLKALFQKYQQDKKNAGSSQGSGSSQSSQSSGSAADSSSAVSLELGGSEMPVAAGGEVPVVTEGASMDTLV